MRRQLFYLAIALIMNTSAWAAAGDTLWLLKPERVFDGEQIQTGWGVLVQADTIAFAGPLVNFKPGRLNSGRVIAEIDFPGQTLLPGLIEGHSHILLHPYNEVPWNQQVLEESRAERIVRAVNHAAATLKAGFTTIRDLGTEGAAYDDVGIKTAIEKGLVPGPRMLVATKAIVATGSYAPKSKSADIDYHMGAAEADGVEGLTKEIRTQIGKGADVIKLYGDYRWGLGDKAMPTFTQAEMNTAVEVAGSSGRKVVVHAVTPEGMRRAALAGVSSIEHGDMGTEETFRLMKEKGVAWYPTLAASEFVQQYKGWVKGTAEPEAIKEKHRSFAAALRAGVTIGMGGDVGVYTHGNNAVEMELMAAYGMANLQVLRAATSVNAEVFGMGQKLGRIKQGLLADIVVVEGDPSKNISDIRKVKWVMKGGKKY